MFISTLHITCLGHKTDITYPEKYDTRQEAINAYSHINEKKLGITLQEITNEENYKILSTENITF